MLKKKKLFCSVNLKTHTHFLHQNYLKFSYLVSQKWQQKDPVRQKISMGLVDSEVTLVIFDKYRYLKEFPENEFKESLFYYKKV